MENPYPMQILQLNHVALHVRDVNASTRFYRDVLHLTVMPRPDFSFPGAWLEIQPPANGQPAYELHLIGLHAEQVTGAGYHWALRVASITEAASTLQQHNWPFSGPNTRPDGAKQIFLKDPDGHVVELCEV